MEKMVKAGEWVVGQVNLVNVRDIVPTADNRAVDRGSDSFAELVASIKTVGVLQNLVGRPHPQDPNTIDLRAGGRRYAAACEAGLQGVPVRVLNLTDKEAMEVTMVENLHREQMSPLEEASAIRKMLLAGYSEKEIAGKIDKPWTWVVRRNRLNELSPKWLEQMAKPAAENTVAHFGAAHLEMLARYPVTTQQRLLEQFTEAEWRIPKTASALLSLLAAEERALGDVRWDLDDASLVRKAGACSSCTKRANCVPGLFDDQDQPSPKDDKCLDEACFAKKERAFAEQQITASMEKHEGAIQVTTGYQDRKGAIPSYAWEKVKKTDKGAQAAVVVDGPQAGDVLYVKVKESHGAASKEENKKALVDRARSEFIRTEMETALEAMLRPKWFTLALALDVQDGGLEELMEVKRKPTSESDMLDDAWDRVMEAVINALQWRGALTKSEEAFLVKELGLDLKGIQKRADEKFPMKETVSVKSTAKGKKKA